MGHRYQRTLYGINSAKCAIDEKWNENMNNRLIKFKLNKVCYSLIYLMGSSNRTIFQSKQINLTFRIRS